MVPRRWLSCQVVRGRIVSNANRVVPALLDLRVKQKRPSPRRAGIKRELHQASSCIRRYLPRARLHLRRRRLSECVRCARCVLIVHSKTLGAGAVYISRKRWLSRCAPEDGGCRSAPSAPGLGKQQFGFGRKPQSRGENRSAVMKIGGLADGKLIHDGMMCVFHDHVRNAKAPLQGETANFKSIIVG